jgi:hypothetical protein
MKYFFSVTLILICMQVDAQGNAQAKTYQLISKSQKADLNYKLFKKFNDVAIYENNGLKKAFEPVKGKYLVYVLVAEYMGNSFDGTTKNFHDYLILKVNPTNQQILDGFQYTMEWAEPPAMADLYQVSIKNIALQNQLDLDSLKMRLNDYYSSEDTERTYLMDDGILKIE